MFGSQSGDVGVSRLTGRGLGTRRFGMMLCLPGIYTAKVHFDTERVFGALRILSEVATMYTGLHCTFYMLMSSASTAAQLNSRRRAVMHRARELEAGQSNAHDFNLS